MTRLVNPKPAQVAELPIDGEFFVEGVLTRHERGEREVPSYPGAKTTRTEVCAAIAITTPKGDVVEFDVSTYPLRYESGVLENLRDVEVRIGETVSVRMSVYLDDSLVRQIIPSQSDVQLLVPDEERQRQYDAERDQVADQIAALEAHLSAYRFCEARKVFAAIRTLPLIKREHRHLNAFAGRFPADERPIYESSTYARDAIQKVYGVNFEQFNASEFLVFARQVLHGETPTAGRADGSYLFRLLTRHPFSDAQASELISSTIRVRVPHLEMAGDSHDEYWDDMHLIERCLAQLSYLGSPGALEVFAWVIERCLHKRYFDTRMRRVEESPTPRRLDSLLEHAVRALVESVRHHGLRAPAAFDFGRMLVWNNTLSAYPYMDHVADQLRSVFSALFVAYAKPDLLSGDQGLGNATVLLERIVDSGFAQNQVDAWLNECLRDSKRSWYSRERVMHGRRRAERKLAEWVKGRQYRAFANSVNEVALGLLDLARLDDTRPPVDADADPRDLPAPPHVRVIHVSREGNFPTDGLYEGGILILATNPYVPGCGCSQPKGSTVFGRGGELGLRYVGIMTDHNLRNPHLVLVLPHPDYRTGSVEATRMGFSVVTVSTEGRTHGTAMDYRFANDPVELALGVVNPARSLSVSSTSSGVNAALRFPGAEEYLGRHINELGTYLSAAADTLGGRHQH